LSTQIDPTQFGANHDPAAVNQFLQLQGFQARKALSSLSKQQKTPPTLAPTAQIFNATFAVVALNNGPGIFHRDHACAGKQNPPLSPGDD
jgi:hypothetical protein